MTKKTFTKTFTFALFYSLIWLMSSWLFTSTVDIKQYLASCLIASVVYYLLESRTIEISEIEKAVVPTVVEEPEVKTTRHYTRKENKDSKDKTTGDKNKKKAGRKSKKTNETPVVAEPTPAVLEASTASADETIDDIVFDPTKGETPKI